MSCGCKELLQKITDLVSKEQESIEKAEKEDGPYWARMKKESIVVNVENLLKQNNSFRGCNCENAKTLLEVEKLVGMWEASKKLNEIQSRIQKDEAFHYLEQLLGLGKDKEPPKMRTLDAKTGKITEL